MTRFFRLDLALGRGDDFLAAEDGGFLEVTFLRAGRVFALWLGTRRVLFFRWIEEPVGLRFAFDLSKGRSTEASLRSGALSVVASTVAGAEAVGSSGDGGLVSWSREDVPICLTLGAWVRLVLGAVSRPC